MTTNAYPPITMPRNALINMIADVCISLFDADEDDVSGLLMPFLIDDEVPHTKEAEVLVSILNMCKKIVGYNELMAYEIIANVTDLIEQDFMEDHED